MANKISLGEKIKRARLAATMSQRELAKSLRVTDKAISAYEVGRASPSVEMLQDISKATKHPISYFVADNPVDVEIEMRLKRVEKELNAIRKLFEQARPNQ